MKKETRICKNKYGIESTIIDCYSNAKNKYEASKCVLGRTITKEDFEIEINNGRLIVEEANELEGHKWYVCWSDNQPLNSYR